MIIGSYLYTYVNSIFSPRVSYLQKNKNSVYVDEISVMHVGGGTDIVENKWDISSTSSYDGFN